MSNFRKHPNSSSNGNRSGVVLLLTLILLVALSTLGYTLTSRVAARRHRDRYLIDYCSARYACDSALKYALATLEDLDPQLISRPNEPDFSDLFILNETEYQELLDQLAEENALYGQDNLGRAQSISSSAAIDDIKDANDINDTDDSGFDESPIIDFSDPNSLTIRGPYGPVWPFVTEPVQFEIGTATVTIEIEDENAKYPIGWALLDDAEVQREAEAGFETFCEWMAMEQAEISLLKEDLKDIAEILPFKLEFKPITKTVREPVTTPRTSSSRTRRTTARTRVKKQTISVADQVARQNAAFSQLFHSSMLDREILARPTIETESRKESALKYTSLWASQKVNINTAPRHVLETAFIFGGDADKIAQEIIQQRRIQPIDNIDDLKSALFGYSDSIADCEKYITTTSNLFTVRVTAVSGVAKASAVAAITKNGKKVKRIAVISG
ncbi:MAG: general secretion pathway protein GspK [Phycisphaerales bacterium]|nr:MAG: general secretion pathway protein GspK [Phycisphaerales bacterium]